MEIVTAVRKLSKGAQKIRGKVVYKHPEGIYYVLDLGKYRECFYKDQIINSEVR